MVARPKRKAPKKTKKTKKATKAPGPAAGAVTLAEAKAMVAAKRPKLALRKAGPPPASPAPLGAQRKKLEKDRAEEFERRIREYKATMEIMKRRGARRPAAKQAKGGAPKALAKGKTFQPLQVFAEGDSWFDYPVPFFGGGIIPRLEDELGVPILNLAKAGDEVRYMLGVKERLLLIKHLKQGCPAGGPWDVLLFSGGGNDIVDNPMALWIKDWSPGNPPESHIHQPRFGTALALVRAGFEDLITLRDALSPTTHLVFHGYDFAIPDGRGICFLGPWLKPTFDLRKFPNRAAGEAVVKAMLQQFAAMLQTLTASPKVSFINTQGTLAPKPGSWHNELHPESKGFETFAGLFRKKLKELFPDRVA